MSEVEESPGSGPLAARRGMRQWATLVGVSALLVVAFEAVHVPAALLLGPMGAAVFVATTQGSLMLPRWPFMLAQGIVGCMMARAITPSTLGAMLHNWPLFFSAIIGVVAAAALLGWLLARWQVLPGTTAVWGCFPGAATAMVFMAEAYGADARLVAFMQYLRVGCVAAGASLVAGIWTGVSGGHAHEVVWFPATNWLAFGETLAIAGLGVLLAKRLRIGSGPLLLPMAVSVALQASGHVTIELPPWLLAISYMLVGWGIGLRFTRPILVHAARALPRVIASILVLMAAGGLIAFVLTAVADIDPLTAYLATSPGGADSVAIIAASSKVDVSFVMGLQTARFLVVLFVGPVLARRIAEWTKPKLVEKSA